MKKTSKLLSLVLAILVIVSGMSVVVSAEGPVLTGTIEKENTVTGIVSTTFKKNSSTTYTSTYGYVAAVFNNYETTPLGQYPASGDNKVGTTPLYTSQMSSFNIPLYEAASAINLYVAVRVRNGDSGNKIPVYFSNKAWPLADNLCGAYLSQSADAVEGYTQDGTYEKFVEEANKYFQ